MSEKSCKARINAELKSEIETLRKLWQAYQNGQEDTDEGNIFEHGLSFGYVPAEGRKRGYFRYQISWGGPSDEFRFYTEGNGYRWHVDRIEYVFLDWFDGAKRTLSGGNYTLLHDIFQSLFVECGSCESEFMKAQE